jgi:alpha-N-arabinofuranosidase
MERRQFLKNSTLAGTVLSLSGLKTWAASAEARIEVFRDEPGSVVSPNLFGQFAEHIGGVVYDGIWVGEGSKISNRFGIRSKLIDMLSEIKVPVIRWPGGCFADTYDWMDGIGPSAERPTRTNFWEVDHDVERLHEQGKQVFEPNQFGTNEFMRLCRMTGAQPYFAANVRSLPALSFDRWVEYCNAPRGSTTLARLREAAGFSDPFKVRYWGVGNESWGCGGNFTPEEYASEFRRYTAWLPRYGLDLQLVGSGPNSDDLDWTHRFFEQIYTNHSYENSSFTGWSVHCYATNLSRGKTDDWYLSKGDALAFDSTDWYEVMRQCNRIEQIIQNQWAAMGQYDTGHNVKLVVDEYGPWYREGTEVDPTHIFGQQVTIRDAVATALTLDTFIRHAEKVSLATNAQLVNNINALFLAHEDRFVATPNYHVFGMYSAHQGGQSIRAEFSAPEIHYDRDGKPASFWSLNGSASIKENVITLTVVHPELTRPMDAQIALHGTRISHVAATALTAGDMHAHNTFDDPNAVKPTSLSVDVSGGLIAVSLPPASVVKLEIRIG